MKKNSHPVLHRVLFMSGGLAVFAGLENYYLKNFNTTYLFFIFIIGLLLIAAYLLLLSPKTKKRK